MAHRSDQDWWQLTKKTVLQRNCHMFNNPSMSDIQFTCGESKRKHFYAHKYVLATSSPVFYAMFYGDLAEKNSVIHLEDADEESFEEFLRFLYTDECTITPEIAVRVMYLAKKYMAPCLLEECISILKNSLNTQNVFTILEKGVQFDEEELQKKCWEVVCSQTHKAVTSDNFNNVSKQTVDHLLKQETLDVKEVELFKAVLKWSDHECKRKGLEATGENKRAILDEAVYQIRFLSMTQEEFAQNVSSSGVLTSEEVVSIYDEFNDKEVPSFKWKLSKRKLYLHRCSRFNNCVVGKSSSWPHFIKLREYHGLDFSVSEPVRFHGVRLLSCQALTKITTDFKFNSNEVKVEATNFPDKLDVDGFPGFDVMLPTPILVNRNEVVRIVSVLSYTEFNHEQSPAGQYGKELVTVNGITLTFRYVRIEGQENETNVNSGQFHQILFTKLY